MSSFYQRKGAGRPNATEKKLVSEIEKIISENDLDSSDVKVCETVTDLQNLRDRMKDEYSSSASSAHEDPESESEDYEAPDPVEKTKPEETNVEEERSLESFDDVKMSDFEEIKPDHAFVGNFDPADLHKINPNASSNISDDSYPAPPDPQEDRPKTAWEIKKEMASKVDTSERLDAFDEQPDDSAPEPSAKQAPEPVKDSSEAVLSEDEEKKIKLAKSASKKATKSLARQSAKIFEWILEIGVKKFTKISEKYLRKLEADGEVDRHLEITDNGKTIAQVVEAHNDNIDEIIKVDPDDRDDLIEAIMLVAEEQDLKASPMANLGMVIMTMGITLGKAGYDAQKQTKKLIKQGIDNYVVGVQKLNEKDKEIEFLKKQLSFQNGSTNGFNTVQPPEPAKNETAIRQLSFGADIPEKPTISFGKPEHDQVKEREFKEAENMLETVGSEISGEAEAKAKKKAIK